MAIRDWTDINVVGRLLMSGIKEWNTKTRIYFEQNNIDMAMACWDRVIKTANTYHNIVQTATGVKELIREGKKIAPDIPR